MFFFTYTLYAKWKYRYMYLKVPHWTLTKNRNSNKLLDWILLYDVASTAFPYDPHCHPASLHFSWSNNKLLCFCTTHSLDSTKESPFQLGSICLSLPLTSCHPVQCSLYMKNTGANHLFSFVFYTWLSSWFSDHFMYIVHLHVHVQDVIYIFKIIMKFTFLFNVLNIHYQV